MADYALAVDVGAGVSAGISDEEGTRFIPSCVAGQFGVHTGALPTDGRVLVVDGRAARPALAVVQRREPQFEIVSPSFSSASLPNGAMVTAGMAQTDPSELRAASAVVLSGAD